MKSKWIIHFSGDDYWHSNPHSRHHITKEFNEEYNVLWINPMGARMPSVKKSGFAKRIIRKLKSLSKLLTKVNDDLYVTTFISIPVFKTGRTQNFNKRILKLQLQYVARKLGINEPLLFYTSPVYALTLGMIKYKAAIYYYSDQYTEYREFDEETRNYTIELDKILYSNSDLIMCASQKIYDNVASKTNKKVVYFPHQVDYKLFNIKEHLIIPDDIKEIKKPIIGYYGTLSDSNDWEIIEYCAKNRPDYNFVFIGRKDIKKTGLEDFSNVHFLGKKPFSEIPHYGHCFDIAMMFWIRREWIINCSPLKLKEYLSMGIPVVSTLIEEVKKHYDDIVFTAQNKEEFLDSLDKALDSRIRGIRIEKGIEKVKSDSWHNAVEIAKNELGLGE